MLSVAWNWLDATLILKTANALIRANWVILKMEGRILVVAEILNFSNMVLQLLEKDKYIPWFSYILDR